MSCDTQPFTPLPPTTAPSPPSPNPTPNEPACVILTLLDNDSKFSSKNGSVHIVMAMATTEIEFFLVFCIAVDSTV